LTNVVAIAGGIYNSLALKNDGTVVAWGAGLTATGTNPERGQSIVPAGLTNAGAISGGYLSSSALRTDGTVLGWGLDIFGSVSIPGGFYQYPSIPVVTNGSVNVNVAGTYLLTYKATNALGTAVTATRAVVVVLPTLPDVTTTLASSITASSATINGTVNPHYGQTKTYFEYGLTTNYGAFTPTNTLAAADSVSPISASINGLASGITYHFRIVATNSAGTAQGQDIPFTTQGAPTINTLSSAIIATNDASGLRTINLSGLVNPVGLITTVSVQYGVTVAYGLTNSVTNLLASFNSSTVTTTISVSPGFTWHWRLVASNSINTTTSSDQYFDLGSLINGSSLAGDLNGDGIVSQSELDAVYANYVTNSPWLYMTNVAGLGGTNVTFALSNSVLGSYTVQYSTNLVNWLPLGPATPRYFYTDTNAPALPQRYYRLTYP
jgi:hypothetical protein